MSHGPPHTRGRVPPADALYVRDTIDTALGLPTTTGQLRDGTEITDEWLQRTGELDSEGAPVFELVTGGTKHWVNTNANGELPVTAHEAAIVDAHGTQRARQAVEAALAQGPNGPPSSAPGQLRR